MSEKDTSTSASWQGLLVALLLLVLIAVMVVAMFSTTSASYPKGDSSSTYSPDESLQRVQERVGQGFKQRFGEIL